MDHGKFVALDAPARLKDILGGDVVNLEVDGSAGPLVDELKTRDWVKTANLHDGVLTMTMEKGERRIPEIVTLAQAHGVAVASVHLHKPSLEDVFLHFTGHTIREREADAGSRPHRPMPGPHGRR
jgi:ABC-2 type transport system ATP-binding protein